MYINSIGNAFMAINDTIKICFHFQYSRGFVHLHSSRGPCFVGEELMRKMRSLPTSGAAYVKPPMEKKKFIQLLVRLNLNLKSVSSRWTRERNSLVLIYLLLPVFINKIQHAICESI